jgi:uncharacterized damage-inducible protein DinB
MHITLLHQYQLILGAREALFDYLEIIKPSDLLQPLQEFNNETINSMMVHSANTYMGWLANYSLQQNRAFFDVENCKDLPSIKQAFEQVNLVVNDFLHHYTNTIDVPITYLTNNKELTTTPLQLFTHVITHEFHHKGQILTMSRLLGYTPIDTDVIRT